MRAVFEAPEQPQGTVDLTIEGMDSEGRRKTSISIRVNGVEIYRDANLLPDDDHPLESGTWTSFTWSFDAALLQPSRNEISISNLEAGTFGLPLFLCSTMRGFHALTKRAARHWPGRPAADSRAIVNAIWYVVWTGCQWKAVQHSWFGVAYQKVTGLCGAKIVLEKTASAGAWSLGRSIVENSS